MKYQKSPIETMSRRLGLLLSIVCPFFLQNCKEPGYEIQNPDAYSNIFMQSASNGIVEKNLPIKDEWVSLSVGAGYGGPATLAQDVQVDFEIAQDQLDLYNQQNNTSYALPPAGSYTFDDVSVQISAGKTGSNSTSIEINPLKLNGTKAYLLPVSIRQVSGNIPVKEELRTTYFLVKGFYETNPYSPISKTDWEVIEVSSEQSDAVGGLGRHCIDGDLYTAWLSRYSRTNNVRPVHPHHVIIDMHNTETLHGMQIFGRRPTGSQSSSSQDYLFPVNIHIETSDNGSSWQSAGIFSMTMAPSGAPEATVYLEQAASCRFIKVTVLRSHGNGDTTAIAELVAF